MARKATHYDNIIEELDFDAIAARCKEARVRLHLTQPKAEAYMEDRGVTLTQSTISRMEKGESLTFENIFRVCKGYNVSLDWLFFGRNLPIEEPIVHTTDSLRKEIEVLNQEIAKDMLLLDMLENEEKKLNLNKTYKAYERDKGLTGVPKLTLAIKEESSARYAPLPEKKKA